MAKHVAEVSVTGNAESKLDKIADGFNKAALAAKDLGKASNDLGDVGDKLDKIGAIAKSGFMSEMGSKIGELGAKMNETFSRMYEKSKETFMDIVKEASAFEDIGSSLKFAFGAQSDAVFEQVKKDAADLTFTLADVSELASSLGRMKINPFGGTEAADQLFMSRTGEKIRALAVLQDTADAVGKSTQDLTAAIRNTMAGDWVSLQDRFDIPKDKIKQWKKEIDGLKEPQEKYNALVKNLGLMFGGAGALKAENYTKIVAQIPDLIQQIKAGVGGEGLKVLTGSLKEFVASLTDFAKDKEAVAALGAAFKLLATAVGYVITIGARAVTFLRHLLASAPFLPILAMGLFIMVGAGLALAGALAGVTAATMAAVSAFAALEAEMLIPALVMLPLIVAGFAALGAAILVGYAAFQIFSNNLGGVGDTFTKIRAVVGGLIELIQSYNGETGTMSAETAKTLKDLGMFDTVKDIFMTFHKASEAFEAFKAEMQDMGELIAPVFLPMLDEMKDLFYELGAAFTGAAAGAGDSAGQTRSWTQVAKDLAMSLMEITHAIITVIRWGVALSRLAVHFGIVTAAIWTAKIALGLLVVALGVFIAGTALVAAPFLLVAGIVAGIVAGLVKAYNLYKAFTGAKSGEGTKAVKEEWNKDMINTKDAPWNKDGGLLKKETYQPNLDPMRQRRDRAGTPGRDKEGNWVGYSGPDGPVTAEEEERIARGGAPRRDNKVGAKAVEDFDTMYKRGASAPGEAAVPTAQQAQGGGPAPGTAGEQQGHAKVAAAVQAQTGALEGIQAALAAFQVSVEIDGEKIARAVNKSKAGAGGAA